MKQKTLFDEENRLELLSQLGDPLEILNRVIKWEKFRSVLNQGCRKEDTGKGGRPPYDVVMMFKNWYCSGCITCQTIRQNIRSMTE